MAERSLSELVQQAEQLSTHMDEGVEELPRVDRSLTQILHSAQNIFSPNVAGATGSDDAQASILLGSRGLDLLHMNHRLEALSSTRTLEPLTPAPDTDIVAFLKNERHNAIISAIEDTRRETHAEVEHLFWEQQKSEWEQAKQKFMSAFANVNADSLNISSLPQESLLNTISLSSRTGNMSIEETQYAKVVLEFNSVVLQGGIRPPLAELLSKSASSLDDQNISDLWSLVCSLTDVPTHFGEDSASRSSSKVQAALIKQARKHLEKSYERHMRNLVYSHLEKANLGGVPGLVPLVKAYLSVVLPPHSQVHFEDGEANGAPIWPLIFYCLRAGGPKAASAAAQGNSNPCIVEVVPALEQLDRMNSNHLPADLERKLKLSYKRNVKNMTDPFKRIVYCVLCRCDVDEDHPDVIATTDDYLWLKLSVVECDEMVSSHRPAPSTNKSKADDVLLLSRLQNMLYVQYGEKHFNAWQQPLLYVSVLLLTGQFECAIEFLSRIERLRSHAVHVALALNENDLLTLSSQSKAPLLSRADEDRLGVHRLNLVQLIRMYVKKFEITNLNEALHYYFFLRSLKGGNSQNLFIDCICDLALQSREFDVLLGVLNTDGSRTPGIIDKFKIDVCEVAEFVAKDSEEKGLHEDAIKLFDLAKNHEKCLSLLNRLLSQVVHLRGLHNVSGHGSKRERVIEMGAAIALRYKTHGHVASLPNVSTLHLMLDIATFFDLYHQERFTEAVDVLKRLRIIALLKDEVEPRVTSVSSLGAEIKMVLPHILLAAMTGTYRLYQSPTDKESLRSPVSTASPRIKANVSVLNTSSQALPATKYLKEQARAIVTFAGMIPMRLNADVNARLVQMEALIN